MTDVRDLVAGILGGGVDYETGLDRLTVAAEAEAELNRLVADQVEHLARRGWQPVELHRLVARGGDPLAARLVVSRLREITAASAPVDDRWRAQMLELGESGPVRSDRIERLDAALGLLRTLRRLPAIEVLIPPPGTVAAAPATGADPRLLARVRALLAKAEATDFPAEAETYTAKAQELIARHSIEDLTAAPAAEVVPLVRRIGVDHPYEGEKASLLDAVAGANRCRTVWSPELGFSTVFGFDADIDAVELLYTSLLVQSHRAMTANEPRAGKARIKAFRRSFLIAYAVRIGERLEAVTAAAAPSSLLPVLATRDAAVRETMDRIFPRTERVRGTRIDSAEGWHSGREAADRARF